MIRLLQLSCPTLHAFPHSRPNPISHSSLNALSPSSLHALSPSRPWPNAISYSRPNAISRPWPNAISRSWPRNFLSFSGFSTTQTDNNDPIRDHNRDGGTSIEGQEEGHVNKQIKNEREKDEKKEKVKNERKKDENKEKIKNEREREKGEKKEKVKNEREREKDEKKEKGKEKEIQSFLIRCDGCNVRLQCKDKEKYGYITQKVLEEAMEWNTGALKSAYTRRVKSKDDMVKQFLHSVERESGITVFNKKTSEMENLDNLEVMMRLEEKMQVYEEEQQLSSRYGKERKEILCFRCFSLKHHHRLPEQYDRDPTFTTDSTEFVLSKVFNRHKDRTVEYFFVIDVLDMLGTFQGWLFQRLVQQKSQHRITVIVNKLDLVSKKYLNEDAVRRAVRSRMGEHLSAIAMAAHQEQIKVFFISCNSRDGLKKLKDYLGEREENIQLIGFPNTGKTTLLNILARLSKSTSKVPGTTLSLTEHSYQAGKKKTIFDMPGLHSEALMYNLVRKPSARSLLTWHKQKAPGLLTHSTFFFGGKLEIEDVRIIAFVNGGTCCSDNRWFLANYRNFWKGMPDLPTLEIQKHQITLQFTDGRADDLQVAGLGFFGFRLCGPGSASVTRRLLLYLPSKVSFGLRDTILARDNSTFHNRSAIGKKFDLNRMDN